MRKILIALIFALSPFAAYAQGTEAVQRSSNPLGMRIQGNKNTQASPDAQNKNTNAATAGEENTVTNSANNVKSSTQIQGATSIKASARNVSGVASGINNAAGNEVGAIGK
ncbi:hypothetical protein [Propionivibrio sp.]|uniref:hypothetical protein n=1 Tax=Propionivibrio sp. TaxID=2212460 RepID=UPI003BF11FD2